MPPTMAGQDPANSILYTFRKQQLLDLCKAYEIVIRDERADKKTIVFQMVAAEQAGVFFRPPKHPYYFERARFTSDQVKEAQSNGGFTRNGVAVTFLFPWTGPAPDPVVEKPKPTAAEVRVEKRAQQKENASKSVIAQLRTRCKELGLNSFGKSREALAVMIAEAEGKIQKADHAA